MMLLFLFIGFSPWAELDDFEQESAAVHQRSEVLREERSVLERRLTSLEVERGVLQTQIDRLSTRLERRLRSVLRRSSGVRAVLLGQTASLTDYVTRRRLLTVVARHDAALHEKAMGTVGELDSTRRSMRKVAQRLEETILEASRIEEELGQKRQLRMDWLRVRIEQPELRAELEAEYGALPGDLLQQISRSIHRLDERSIRERRGQISWPIAAARSQAFGTSAQSTQGINFRHEGWSFDAPVGTAVSAVHRGRVVHRGWIRGFGDVVVIDHGENLHSLYANLLSIAVDKDQEVEGGAQIGRSGGLSMGSLRFHFQIRDAGVPVDPVLWLK